MPTTHAETGIRDAPTNEDLRHIALQLGRAPRGVLAVRARCANGWPTVVETQPRLADGTPFPTFYYLTCRTMNSAISTLEAEALMRHYEELLHSSIEVRRNYASAHDSYLAARAAALAVAEIDGVSAGGMPTRVKCLHALVAHALAVGPGVNPIGDLALTELVERDQWPHGGPCVAVES